MSTRRTLDRLVKMAIPAMPEGAFRTYRRELKKYAAEELELVEAEFRSMESWDASGIRRPGKISKAGWERIHKVMQDHIKDLKGKPE